MKNNINWNFDNTYSKLPEPFREKINPVKVKNPKLILLNESLAKDLNLDFSEISQSELSAIFTGNELPKNSNSIALAYAGHQFGHFTMLGDGRAVLIGEHVSKNNHRYDIQFKGSGKTAFSRNGDGRAALGPMLREYLISEAMYALNIPTTRSLAVAKTGENVIRETPIEGVILTIKRHYPEIENSKNKALDLLKVVLDKQIDLVVNWMRVGFIHGVMNTDNMSIAGETIDYGPCAFMDIYDPKTVFSSIDKLGRYAYCNQPVITKWNLSRFAECLIPLIDKDQDTAVKLATEIIDTFEKTYEEKWLNMMRAKLGLIGSDKKDKYLILDLLTWMHQNKVDYTNTFCHLMNFKTQKDNIYEGADFSNWKKRWQERSSSHNNSKEKHKKLMRSTNPLLIPRNHIVENTLRDADQGNLEPLLKFLKILNSPYTDQKDISEYQILSSSNENYQTFCGT